MVLKQFVRARYKQAIHATTVEVDAERRRAPHSRARASKPAEDNDVPLLGWSGGKALI
jgi:hypothetical protein